MRDIGRLEESDFQYQISFKSYHNDSFDSNNALLCIMVV